jgi:hypothetical protein
MPSPRSPVPPPRNALSLQLTSLLDRGVTIQFERQVAPRFSVATSLGRRWSGGKSFDTSETGFGAEGRYWLFGRGPLMRPYTGPAMVGPFVAFRTDAGITRVDDGDRLVGSSLRLAESLALGARVAIAGRVELSSSLGFGLRHDFDPRGRLAPWTRFEPLRFGMTAGILF